MIAVAYVYQADQVPTGSTGGDYWEIPATATSGAYLSDETVAHEDQKPRTLPLSHCATHHRPAAVARRGLNSSLSPEHAAAQAERALALGRTAPGRARRPWNAHLSTLYERATWQAPTEAGWGLVACTLPGARRAFFCWTRTPKFDLRGAGER